MLMMFFLALVSSYNVQRSIWKEERSGEWWERVVKGSFTRQEWIENFRMSEETFLYVCNKLRSFIAREDTKMKLAVSTEKQVAITLWRLATNSDYRTIGHLFGIARGTVCVIINEVCCVIVRLMLRHYVKIPTGEDLAIVVNGFETQWGFPQCAGAVDGTHIPIVAPEECRTDYFNQKGFYSVIMQATVDHQYCFIDINIGWPGWVHDARVFSNSELFKKSEDGTLFPSWQRHINGVDVPILILGDPAYPLLAWLMKPFPDNGRLSEAQQYLNYRLSKARMVVENAFGRLKGRWRCLLKRNNMDIKHLPNCIATYVVLHNLCERKGEQFDDNWLTPNTSSSREEEPDVRNAGVHGSAQAVRNAIMQHLCTHPL